MGKCLVVYFVVIVRGNLFSRFWGFLQSLGWYSIIGLHTYLWFQNHDVQPKLAIKCGISYSKIITLQWFEFQFSYFCVNVCVMKNCFVLVKSGKCFSQIKNKLVQSLQIHLFIYGRLNGQLAKRVKILTNCQPISNSGCEGGARSWWSTTSTTRLERQVKWIIRLS